MKKLSLALFLSFLLVGCDTSKDEFFSLDAFPVVKDAALSLSPKFGGKRNDIIMSHVCAVADNTESIDDLNEFFLGKNIDLSDLADKDSGFKLLSDGSLHEMEAACMGYIISSLFTPIPKRAIKELKNNSGFYLAENNFSLNEMSTRIKIAKTSAKFFSIISTEAEKEKFDNFESARDYLLKLFKDNSGLYFEILSGEKRKEESFKIDVISEGKISLCDEDGFAFLQEDKSVSLFFHGVNWLANGEVLGKKYLLKISSLNN